MNPRTAPPVKLHELPQRRIESTCQLIEESLNRMEELLRPDGRKWITRRIESRLSASERGRWLEGIARLRALLAHSMKRFELRPRRVDLARILAAELSTAWVMLEDCLPERMKGFGVKWEEPVRRALEEQLAQLLDEIVTLHRIID